MYRSPNGKECYKNASCNNSLKGCIQKECCNKKLTSHWLFSVQQHLSYTCFINAMIRFDESPSTAITIRPPIDNRDFKIQDATAFRTRWPGKRLERGWRCKRWKFKLRFATQWGQYQYLNPYEGFNEETRNGFLPKTSRITATLLGGRNYRRRRIFSALRGVRSTKSSISALGIREIFSQKQKFCRMLSWFLRQ